ncbi:unnamed protein product [Tenebrio molitor]|nr:unnamed protein product [Tenebrio molitor]
MRRLVFAAALIGTVCAYHVNKVKPEVVIDWVEYTNIPAKYELGKMGLKALVPEDTILTELHKKSRSGTEANLNDFADKLFANLQSWMIHNAFDPVELPDMRAGIHNLGEIKLNYGWLLDLSTIHRGGDVLLSYSHNTKYITANVPISFNDLEFTYDYSAKILGMGPTGGIVGKVTNVQVEVVIGFNIETLRASLDEFYIVKAGQIDFEFSGNALVDWLLDLLSDVVATLLKKLLLLVVEGLIRGGLESTIDTINDAIGGFVNPTTPVLATNTAALLSGQSSRTLIN